MKKWIKFLVFVGIVYLAEKSCSFRGLLFNQAPEEQVALGEDELSDVLDENEQLASETTDLRKDLFSILLALNGITDDALALERGREIGRASTKRVTQQIHIKMDVLRSRIEDARQRAGNNDQLQREIDRLEKSLIKKEREISRLNTSIADVNDKIGEAVKDLEVETGKLKAKEADLKRVNQDRQAAVSEKNAIDQRAWIAAGNELVNAAKMIPRPSIGRQSDAIVRAKKLLLQSARIDCYYVAVRINPETNEAQIARNLAIAAQSLYERAAKRKDIGERTVVYEEE